MGAANNDGRDVKRGAYDLLRRRAAERMGQLDLDPVADPSRVRAEVERMVDDYQRRAFAGDGIRPVRDPVGLADRLLDSLAGYGPLTALLERTDIEEIFIEGERVSYLDGSGRLHPLDVPTSEEENIEIVSRILAGTNRRLDTSNPIEQARVLDGSARLTAVIPPVADRLSVTLRKYVVKDYDLDFLVGSGALSGAAAGFLWTAARTAATLIFSGAPGVGKTTMLSAYLRALPADRCVRVCEEVREVHVPLTHGSCYEASPPALDGTRRYTLRDLVKVVLAQRPDLICVGEVRGAEAFELTRAVNAGCGFACTIHADSARRALAALVNAALMAGENITESIVTRVFGDSIDFVVHLRRDTRPPEGPVRGVPGRRVQEIICPAASPDGSGFSSAPLFVREKPDSPLEWTGEFPLPEAAARLEGALPAGTGLERVLAGEWSPGR